MSQQLAGLQFGSGVVFGTPNAGNLATDPTPLPVGVIQDVKLTLGADLKSLFGQQQWAVDSAVGKRTIKGTVNFAQLSNMLLSQLFFADNVATGIVATSPYPGEAHSIPGTSPYTVTIDPPNSGVFVSDQGVIYAATGQPLTAIPTGTPAAGQYTVNASTGVYTFAAADEGKGILVNYTYTQTTTGTSLVVSSHTMGWGPILAMNLVFPYDGIGIGVYLPNVRLGKIDMSSKLDDYAMFSSDFEAFAGAAGTPATFYQAF
jgi:hypothetical protein